MIRIWLCCVMLFAGSVAAAEVPIRAWNLLLDHPNPAVAGLLRLSLDLTVPEYGPYRLIASPPMEQGRAVKALQSGELVQIGVFAPDEERERTLLAIHVPLAKGLLGWRVCLIRQGDEGRFANIRSLTDWQQVNRYEIYPRWRHRYPAGVTHNEEHVFSLCVPDRLVVTLAPQEHLAAVWLPYDRAAGQVFSPSNAEALRQLPRHYAAL